MFHLVPLGSFMLLEGSPPPVARLHGFTRGDAMESLLEALKTVDVVDLAPFLPLTSPVRGYLEDQFPLEASAPPWIEQGVRRCPHLEQVRGKTLNRSK